MNSNEHQKISMKSYTDIGQSRKLAESLPIESADMYYEYVLPRSNKLKHIPSIGNPVEALEWYNKGYTHFGKEPLSLKEYCIPCWSLAALLDQLEDTIYDEDGNAYELVIKKENVQFDIYYLDIWGEQDNIELDRFYDDLIDCCYEMILKLHKQKLL